MATMPTIQLFLLPCFNTRARQFRCHPRFVVSYRADGEPQRPIVHALRAHNHLVEVHVHSVARFTRDGRPIVAAAAHIVQRTVEVETIARSGEPHGGIRMADFVVEVVTVVPGTIYIEF